MKYPPWRLLKCILNILLIHYLRFDTCLKILTCILTAKKKLKLYKNSDIDISKLAVLSSLFSLVIIQTARDGELSKNVSSNKHVKRKSKFISSCFIFRRIKRELHICRNSSTVIKFKVLIRTDRYMEWTKTLGNIKINITVLDTVCYIYVKKQVKMSCKSSKLFCDKNKTLSKLLHFHQFRLV
jgi:hypothetical protein